MFRRPTFPQLHEAEERLLATRMCGETPVVAYDNTQLYSNHTVIIFVPWHVLSGIVNRSIDKTRKYRQQSPEGAREQREKASRQFDLKYVLAVMNPTFAKEFVDKRRRSKLDVYPDDWKQLPIAPIPKEQQQEFVRLVDAILAEFEKHGYPLPPDTAERVAGLHGLQQPRDETATFLVIRDRISAAKATLVGKGG